MFPYQLLNTANIYKDHFNIMTFFFAQGMSLDVDIGGCQHSL